MNCKEGFKRLLITLPLAIGLCAFYGGATMWAASNIGGYIWGFGVILIYFLLLIWVFFSFVRWVIRGFELPKSKIMTREEMAVYRQRLRTILINKDDGQRLKELKQLAKKVGAGYVHTEIAPIAITTPNGNGSETIIHQNPIAISESELVLNINNALQTETMIDMCKTAARNFWITMVVAIAAVLSALAACWAIAKMVR